MKAKLGGLSISTVVILSFFKNNSLLMQEVIVLSEMEFMHDQNKTRWA